MKQIKILSFDCANKSLAVCYILYNIEWRNDVLSKIGEATSRLASSNTESYMEALELYSQILVEIDGILNNIYKIEYYDVFDLLDGKKVKDCDAITRVSGLHKCLQALPFRDIDYVIVEDQMSLNEKSRGVYYCILYHYIGLCEVISMKACQKNKHMNFGAGDLRDYRIKYSDSYRANKAHSKANFISYLSTRKQTPIPKRLAPYADDIADAFFQVIAASYQIPTERH